MPVLLGQSYNHTLDCSLLSPLMLSVDEPQTLLHQGAFLFRNPQLLSALDLGLVLPLYLSS